MALEKTEHDEEEKKWLRIATNLEKSLKASQAKISMLKRTLSQTTTELQETKKECAVKSDRINDLELQCIEKSEKLATLSIALESRDTNELQEQLLQRSMAHAEENLSVGRLRMELQKSDLNTKAIIEERDTLQEVNEELARKVEDTTFLLDKVKREYDRNSKLLLEMGDIVRTLNCVTVSFDMDHDKNGNSPQESPIKNIKRKIQAMEDDRKRLREECASLRRDNDKKREQILSFESQQEHDRKRLREECTSLRKDNDKKREQIRSLEAQQEELMEQVLRAREQRASELRQQTPLQRPISTQTSPQSIDSDILDQADDDYYEEYEHESQSRYDEEEEVEDQYEESQASDNSSFSTLDPPEVPIDVFDALKKDYEIALDKIVHLSAELGKAKAAEQDTDEMEQQYEELRKERDDALKNISRLEEELEDALNVADDLAAQNEHVKAVGEERLAEQRAKFEKLQTAYEQLQKENNSKLGELERQVISSEDFFQIQCDGLKHRHLKKLEAKEKEFEEMKTELEDSLALEKKRYEELSSEFETSLEMHTELEEEFAELQRKYDEALTTIVSLEDKLEETRCDWEVEKTKYMQQLEDLAKSTEEIKASAEKYKNAMLETSLELQKLQREHEDTLAGYGKLLGQLKEAGDREKRDAMVIAELKDNCCDLQSKLKRTEKLASTQHGELQVSYNLALEKVDTFCRRLRMFGHPIEEFLNDITESNATTTHVTMSNEFDDTEHDILPKLRCSKELPKGVQFHKDYNKVIKNAMEQVGPTSPFWMDRLVHQSRTFRVHQEMFGKPFYNDIAGIGLRGNPFFDWLQHYQKQSLVREALSGILVVSQSQPLCAVQTTRDFFGHMKRLEAVHSELIIPIHEKKREKKTIPFLETVTTIDSNFLLHQRRLNVVHFDVIAHARIGSGSVHSLRSVTSLQDSEVENWTLHGPESIDDARMALRKLKGEARKIKLVASTAKIRYEAREKEHKVVLFQYKNLLEAYNQAVKNQAKTTSPSELGGPNRETPTSQRSGNIGVSDAELERLRRNLRAAEQKVEAMGEELRATKCKAEEAQKKHVEGERRIKTMIGQCEKLETSNLSSVCSEIHSESDTANFGTIFRSSGLIESRNSAANETDKLGRDGSVRMIASFDGSLLTSFGGTSAEGRDEKGEREKVRVEGSIDCQHHLQQEHNRTLQALSLTKGQLADALTCAESAKTRLQECEQELSKVRNEYKELRVAFGRLSKEAAQSSSGSVNDANESILRERDMALARISILESAVETAKAAAKSARNKQLLREDHLRQVIDQYKQLELEHNAAKERIRMLKTATREMKDTKKGQRGTIDRSDEVERYKGTEEAHEMREVGKSQGVQKARSRNDQSNDKYVGREERAENANRKSARQQWFRTMRGKLNDRRSGGM